MRRTLAFAAVVAFSLTAVGAAPALAAPCKDVKGRFIKCPPPHPMPMKMVRCKDVHGKFMKCGLPGAHPY
jgi:hypothetical protein